MRTNRRITASLSIAILVFLTVALGHANEGKYCTEDNTICFDLKANNKFSLFISKSKSKNYTDANMSGSFTVNCDEFHFDIEQWDEKAELEAIKKASSKEADEINELKYFFKTICPSKPLLEGHCAKLAKDRERQCVKNTYLAGMCAQDAEAWRKLCPPQMKAECAQAEKQLEMEARIKKSNIQNMTITAQEKKRYIDKFEKLLGAPGYIFKNSMYLGDNVLTKAGLKQDFPKQYFCSNGELKEKAKFTDPRDGKTYTYVNIGSQTWMAENLNWHGKDGYLGLCEYKEDKDEDEDEKPEICENYGRLYSWAEAMGIDRKYDDMFWKEPQFWRIPRNLQGVCPDGWYLPGDREWQTLIKFAGGRESAKKKLTRRGQDESKCKYKTKDDRGRVTEHNDCTTDEYGFSGPVNAWSIAEYYPEPGSGSYDIHNGKLANIVDDYDNRSYGYSSDKYDYKYGVKSYPRHVRCLKETAESKAAATEAGAAEAAALAKRKALEEKFAKTEIKDPSGKKYEIVMTGGQIWMAQNLRQKTKGSKCSPFEGGEDLGNNEDCVFSEWDISGMFYDWNTAKSVCPKGWRLPTDAELANAINDKQYPIQLDGYDGIVEGAGARWWTSKENGKSAIAIEIEGGKAADGIQIYKNEKKSIDKKSLNSVRCVMNDGTKKSAEGNSLADNEENSLSSLANLFKGNESKKKEKQEKKQGGEIEWGARIAYNASTVFYEGENSELGSGFEAGIIANKPISNTAFGLSVGANAIYRKPDNKEYMDEDESNSRSELTEYIFSVPVLLQYNIELKELAFYVQAGAQIDVLAKAEQKITKGEEETYQECPWRNSYDLGLVLGLGWRINETLALDIKGVRGISEFNKEVGGYMLIQGNIGLSYFF